MQPSGCAPGAGTATVVAPPAHTDGQGGEIAIAKLQRVTPILSVGDVGASIAYYLGQLGFTDRWQWGEPPEFGGASRDGVEVLFCKDHQGKPGTWVSVWVDDVDALHEELDGRGADIVQPPTTFERGVREMNVRDPDGHRLRFSTETDQPSDGVPFPGD